ncbi:MAG: glycine--tRNA ligase subunit beta, partial [Candidatus Omnitrophica bacterium]|nr:glycine--tRNA ligase subunit beta [Candidatus Omnitrophota bacterium]
LVGAFGAGFIPTGSQDPYALRRAAGGIVKIIRAFGFSFSLDRLVKDSKWGYGSERNFSPETEAKLKQFFRERLFFELNLKPGTRDYEILDAVAASGFNDVSDVLKRFEELRSLAGNQEQKFLRAAKIVERTGNILKGVKEKIANEVHSSDIQEPLEKDLLRIYLENESKFNERIRLRDYSGATCLYGDVFYEPVHRFFDQVMVNAEDAKVRAGRQALVKKIYSLYASQIADLSLVSGLK